MALCQDASFEKPKIKDWHKKYVRLEFTASIKELEKIIKELKAEGNKEPLFYKSPEEVKWMLEAFLKKCQCPQCKPAWEAFEKKQKELLKKK